MKRGNVLASIACLFISLLLFSGIVHSQGMSRIERGMAKDMLRTVMRGIKQHYFDPNLKGVDWDKTLAETEKRIDSAESMGMALSYIAAAVDTLNDSHTHFYPPSRAHYFDYGVEYQIVGDRCFITQVRSGSDTEKKGIKVGDELLTLNGFMPDRATIGKMRYVFYVLRPQASLTLLLQDPATGKSREVTVTARTKLLKRPTDMSLSNMREAEKFRSFRRAAYVEIGDAMILKLPTFSLANTAVGTIVSKANNHGTLILDLRGNPGGYVKTLEFLVGAMFDRDVTIGDRVMRDETKPLVAKKQRSIFSGKLIVLVDAESASASEVFARIVQLEKRGVVIGDKTMGSVMESRWYQNKMGGGDAYFYGEDITHADLIMTDGKRLEHVGVTPDEIHIPTGLDLVNHRDPVLSYAAKLAGVELSPEAAGKIFTHQWPPDPE